jgi:hypothetical protein
MDGLITGFALVSFVSLIVSWLVLPHDSSAAVADDPSAHGLTAI